MSSVQFSRSVVSDPVISWTAARQASLSITNCQGLPNPCPLSRWCHLTISSFVVPFSSCPQSFPASGSFQMSQLFAWGGQSIGVSALTSVLPMNTQDWSPLGWTFWISLQSKGLSRVFSNTTVQKHQFFWIRSQNLFLFRLKVYIMNNISPFLLPPANIFFKSDSSWNSRQPFFMGVTWNGNILNSLEDMHTLNMNSWINLLFFLQYIWLSI